jgi:hypothetical protein
MLKLNSLSGFGGGVSVSRTSGINGYICGGQSGGSPTKIDEIEKLVYATDTSTLTGAETLELCETTAGVTDQVAYGYGLSGDNGHRITATFRLAFSTDTIAAATDADAIDPRYSPESLSGEGTAGYLIGGNAASGGRTDTSEKLTYSTATMATMTSTLIGAIQAGGCIDEGVTHGYQCGGAGASGNTDLGDKLTYATDTWAATTDADLSFVAGHIQGLSGEGTAGYIAGGTTATAGSTTDKITYATDTQSTTTTMNMPTPLSAGVAVGDGVKAGYIAGGNTGARWAGAYKFTYAAETWAAATDADLTTAVDGPCGISDFQVY